MRGDQIVSYFASLFYGFSKHVHNPDKYAAEVAEGNSLPADYGKSSGMLSLPSSNVSSMYLYSACCLIVSAVVFVMFCVTDRCCCRVWPGEILSFITCLCRV